MHYSLKDGETITIDADLRPKLEGRTWKRDASGIVANIYWDRELKKTRRQSLHDLVLGEKCPQGYVRTHRDGDRSNFRRDNIETVRNGFHAKGVSERDDAVRRGGTIARSGKKYAGVIRRGQRYSAAIRMNGKTTHLGMFATEGEAARAYDRALAGLGHEPVNEPRIPK